MSKLCIKCDAEIPSQRVKMLPNTKVCVQCSTASPHTGMVVSYGEGDHTWTEIVVMDEEQQKEYDKLYIQPKAKIKGDVSVFIEINNLDEDDDIDVDLKSLKGEEKSPYDPTEEE